MTKFNKLLTTAFVSLLAGGMAVAPNDAFAAGSKNPCAPASMRVSNPCAAKVANPCAAKAANPCAAKASNKSDMIKDKAEKVRGKFDYPLLSPFSTYPQG